MRLSFAIALGVFCHTGLAYAQSIAAWTQIDDRHGGLSGLEVSEDGARFTAVSDKGLFYEGRLLRSTDGRLIEARNKAYGRLALEAGLRRDRKKLKDAEALVVAEDGRFFVAYEHRQRILTYRSFDQVDSTIPVPDLPRLGGNKGIEALAIDRDGRLVAIGEASASLRAPFPISRLEPDGSWRHVDDLGRGGGFRPVGADFGPDGALYVLTRAFNGFAFANRVERITGLGTNAKVQERVFSGDYGQFDNLEGIAVWLTPSGETRLIMVSDDNFSDLQKTIFVEIAVDSDLP